MTLRCVALRCVALHTVASLQVLLGLDQRPQTADLLPLQLVQFGPDVVTDEVQLLGQLSLLWERDQRSSRWFIKADPIIQHSIRLEKHVADSTAVTFMSSMSVLWSFSLKCWSFSRKSMTSRRYRS